ncbi:hypothetical protein KIN20_036096 [Parelaphostrongylus tenuis]|uniref:Uncharacterized protein n=1 Tax=Parelaphostrongylus tenuis TaxID=148309 RepID=A0AAD5RC33_PARTN|nr:hypothetical protein KIN20_036096 [Parelaphostrongylus tenuis]
MNVPPYIIAQLEKANDVIRRQSEELDRFRSSDLQVENIALTNAADRDCSAMSEQSRPVYRARGLASRSESRTEKSSS